MILALDRRNLECGGRVPIHRDGDTALDQSWRQWESKAPQNAGATTISLGPNRDALGRGFDLS